MQNGLETRVLESPRELSKTLMPRSCPGIFDLLIQVLVISIKKKNNAPWVSLMGAGMEKLGAWASALLQDPGVGFKQMCKPCPTRGGQTF